MRTVYVNGDYVPEDRAVISVFDRGFLMADGVYEVVSVLDGRLCDFAGHLARLKRSLDALRMGCPLDDAGLLEVHREVVRRNDLVEGVVYLQITRGAADRDFAWPEDAVPGIVLFTQAKSLVESALARRGMKVVSVPDLRWGRRDIKTVQLLYPSLAKMEAKALGADDAWMVQDGLVTEGTSNNAYIVTRDGTIVTRHLGHEILHGITRATLLALVAETGMRVEERPFSIAEAQGAAEAFITAASSFVCPVIEIDGVALGEGVPGAVTRRLRTLYVNAARASAL